MRKITQLLFLFCFSSISSFAQTTWDRIEKAHNNAERVHSDLERIHDVRERVENRDFEVNNLSREIGNSLQSRLQLNSSQAPRVNRIIEESLYRKQNALNRWSHDQRAYDEEMYNVRTTFNNNMRRVLDRNQYRNLLSMSPKRAIKANILSRLLF
jgi:hypothetical protein